jgi:YVTN family beta-propeller protein
MQMSFRHLTIAAALATASPAAAHADVEGPAQGREVMLVANGESGTVSILDARSFKELRTLNVVPDGPAPSLGAGDSPGSIANHQLITSFGGTNIAQDQDPSPDGRTLYVSRGHRGDVAAIDVATGALKWKLAVPGLRADHMTINADGSRLYVSALTANELVAVDTATHAIAGSVATGQWPHDNHLTHDGKLLYNSSIGTIVAPEEARKATSPPPYQLTVIDPSTLKVLNRFQFDRGIRPTAYTSDGRTLYAQRSLESSIMQVRLSDGKIERIAELPVKPGTGEADYDFEAPHHGLALAGDEKTLCVAGRISDYVALVATDTLKPRAIIPVDDAPGWAATSPDGTHCFATNTRADTVSVISYAQAKVVARIRVGDGPKHAEAARLPESILCTRPQVPGCSGDVRLTRTCLRGRRLRIAATGDTDAILRVTFSAGGRRLAGDSAAPYTRTIRYPRRASGRLVATIETSGEALRRTRSLPTCRA